jgi:hypothetical protein
MQDLNLVSDLAEFFIHVAIASDVGAEAPIIKVVNGFAVWPVSRFVGKDEVLA